MADENNNLCQFLFFNFMEAGGYYTGFADRYTQTFKNLNDRDITWLELIDVYVKKVAVFLVALIVLCWSIDFYLNFKS